MSRLIASIQATSATQPVVADGVGYGTDLRRWLRYEPRDPLHQLVAGFHVYNESDCATRACWSDVIARVARRVPVLTGEVGEYDCRHDFLDRYLPWADAHHIGYLGWAWNTYDCRREPSLLADLNGTPSPYGLGLYSHLRSRRDP